MYVTTTEPVFVLPPEGRLALHMSSSSLIVPRRAINNEVSSRIEKKAFLVIVLMQNTRWELCNVQGKLKKPKNRSNYTSFILLSLWSSSVVLNKLHTVNKRAELRFWYSLFLDSGSFAAVFYRHQMINLIWFSFFFVLFLAASRHSTWFQFLRH